MTSDDQKSIVVDVKMKSPGEKWYALEFDKTLRQCTDDCRKFAFEQEIAAGDEVNFTINAQKRFSYLKKTGKTFNLDELPKSAAELLKMKPIIDAEKEQQQKKEPEPEHGRARDPQNPEVPAGESSRINHEVHRSEIIHWQALLNTSVDIVMLGGHCMEEECDIETDVKTIAEHLHDFIMKKVGGA